MLASFPNSGTTYTMQGFQRLSGHAAGSVYETEVSNALPYEQHPYKDVFFYRRMHLPVPHGDRIVLVKSHASQYSNPGAHEGKFPKSAFAAFLEKSPWSVPSSTNLWLRGLYCGHRARHGCATEHSVGGIIRLSRNPLDNVIARLHHRYKSSGVLNITLSSDDTAREVIADLITYLRWHHRANLVQNMLKHKKPMFLVDYEELSINPETYWQPIASITGLNLTHLRISEEASFINDHPTRRAGASFIPAYLQSMYSARPSLCSVLGELIDFYLDETKCLRTPTSPARKTIMNFFARRKEWNWIIGNGNSVNLWRA